MINHPLMPHVQDTDPEEIILKQVENGYLVYITQNEIYVANNLNEVTEILVRMFSEKQ